MGKCIEFVFLWTNSSCYLILPCIFPLSWWILEYALKVVLKFLDCTWIVYTLPHPRCLVTCPLQITVCFVDLTSTVHISTLPLNVDARVNHVPWCPFRRGDTGNARHLVPSFVCRRFDVPSPCKSPLSHRPSFLSYKVVTYVYVFSPRMVSCVCHESNGSLIILPYNGKDSSARIRDQPSTSLSIVYLGCTCLAPCIQPQKYSVQRCVGTQT